MKRLLLAITVFCIFSCQKEDLHFDGNLNPIDETPLDFFEVSKSNQFNSSNNTELRDQAIIGILLVKDIFSTILLTGIYHPEIFGLQSNESADTRSCPTTKISPMGATFPTADELVVELDFGVSPGCSPASTLPVPFIGKITAVFEEPVFGSGNGPDILISLSNDFSINGYGISVANGGTIDLNYLNSKYQVELDDDVTVTDPITGNTTTYHSTTDFGDFNIIADGDDDDNIPTTFINNAYSLFITDSHVTCSGGITSTDHCIDITSSGNNLTFQPVACGCITGGKLRINENSDCTSSNASENVDTTYDFGNGACDSDVNITTSSGTTTETMLSCT